MNEPEGGAPAGARAPVALLPCFSYEPGELAGALDCALDLLGGIGAFVSRGQRVLLKPNLLAAADPASAVCTHPAVVEAAIVAVRAAGAEPFVADSPALGNFKSVARRSGIAEVCLRLGVQHGPLAERAEVAAPDGCTFKRFTVAAEALAVDRVINLARVKTHQQMTLTLGVKNMFGCVVGTDKARWHMRAGRDAALFGRALAELALTLAPALTLLDGVVGMDGDGPRGGRTRPFGFFALGANPFAVDALAARLLGVPPGRVPTLAAGIELGVAPADVEQIEVRGAPDWRALRVEDFRPPSAQRAGFGLPEPLFRLARRLFTPKPRVSRRRCVLCRACIEACPAAAMSQRRGRVHIDYGACISCFCCAEVCPHDAIRVR